MTTSDGLLNAGEQMSRLLAHSCPSTTQVDEEGVVWQLHFIELHCQQVEIWARPTTKCYNSVTDAYTHSIYEIKSMKFL